VTDSSQIKEKCGSFDSNKTVTVDREWVANELSMISNFSEKHSVPVWIDQWGLRASAVGGDAVLDQYMTDILSEFDQRKFHWTYWIWRRTKSWGEGGYPIERQAEDGSYSLFELALKHLSMYLGKK